VPEQLVLDPPVSADLQTEPARISVGLNKFVISVSAGMAVVLVPYLFVLWDLWNSTFSVVRSVGPSDFYDLQAHAMGHGHLYIAANRLGIEAFFHHGRAFTYFGIFPSLLRAPVLALFPSSFGHLTAPSLLAAWLLTGLLASLLLWRVRILIRGSASMAWTEAITCGILIAAITGGSVLVYLAANPWVYDEDLAWSAALTLGVLFTLLGVLERPTGWRVLAAGIFILACSLNRLSTGWACIIGGLLVAVWFLLGRGGPSNRRWCFPMLAAAVIPLVVASAVNTAKFGSPISLPMADQAWTQISAHRRHFLAVNGGRGFGLQFLPSTVDAYLQPGGIRFSSLFPFITLPASPAAAIGGVVLDQTLQTGSVPATMPLLFLLSLWGAVTAFRPNSIGSIRLTRILFVTGALATAGVMLWGYIAERYLADFMPLLILASIVGIVDLWRRGDRKPRRMKATLFAAVAFLALFGLVANVGAALESMNSWTTSQALRFVEAQKALSIGSLASSVVRGPRLPYWGPTGQIYDVNNCSGLYVSSGQDFSYSPGQRIQHATWVPIEQEASINTDIGIYLGKPARYVTKAVPILKYGKAVVMLEPAWTDHFRVAVINTGPAPPWPIPTSLGFKLKLHRWTILSVMTDPYLNRIQVSAVTTTKILRPSNKSWTVLLSHYLRGSAIARVVPTPPTKILGTSSVISVRRVPSISTMSLCHALRGTSS
jgi:hypothetical protein